MSSNLDKTLKGISSQTIITISRGVLEIVVFSIMSRLLTKEEFGYYAVLIGIVTVLKAFSEAGIGASIIQKYKLDKQYIDTAFTLSLILGFLLSFIGCLSSKPLANFLVDDYLTIPIFIISLTLPFYSVNSVARSLFISKLKFLRFGLLQIFSYSVGASVGIYMAINGYGLYSLLVMNVLETLFSTVLLYTTVKYKPRLVLFKPHLKSIISFGGWLTLETFFRNIYHQLDSFLLPKLIPISILGAFNRPKNFLNSVSTHLNGIFDITLFPILSSIQEEKEKIQSALKKSIYFLNLYGCILASAIFFNAFLIVNIFLGEEWLSIVPVFRILAIEFLFKIDGRLVDIFFRSLAYVKQSFIFRIVACVLLTISIIIGYRWGLIGIAASIVICNFCVISSKFIYLLKKTEIPFNSILKEIISAIKGGGILISEGIIYLLFFPETLTSSVIFCFIFMATTFVLFVYFPKTIGIQYYNLIYPKFYDKIFKYLPFK